MRAPTEYESDGPEPTFQALDTSLAHFDAYQGGLFAEKAVPAKAGGSALHDDCAAQQAGTPHSSRGESQLHCHFLRAFKRRERAALAVSQSGGRGLQTALVLSH